MGSLPAARVEVPRNQPVPGTGLSTGGFHLRAAADSLALHDFRDATVRGVQERGISILGNPMNQYDSRQAPGAEPAEGNQPWSDSPQGEDAGAHPACWEGYSLDTLAALDGLPPAAC
jgi:hypothetical protein